MKKMLTVITMSFSMLFADAALWVCDYDGTDTFTVCMNSDDPVNGAQFGISVPGFTTTSIGLTSATAAWQQYGPDGVLGFFFGVGEGVSAGNEIPMFTFTGSWDGSASGGAASVVAYNGSLALSDPLANSIETTAVDNDWDGTTLDGDNGQPADYQLSNAYPNPFNPTTSIDYNVANPGSHSSSMKAAAQP
jgi:hypothetical protein